MSKGAYGDATPETNDKDPFERDKRVESLYNYARDVNKYGQEPLSTVAFVSAYRSELAKQFFDWRRNQDSGPVEDALVRWEVMRFGCSLEKSSHGMLWFEVRSLIYPDDQRYSSLRRPDKPTPTTHMKPGLTDAQRKDRMLTALDKVAEAKAMPGLRLDVDRA